MNDRDDFLQAVVRANEGIAAEADASVQALIDAHNEIERASSVLSDEIAEVVNEIRLARERASRALETYHGLVVAKRAEIVAARDVITGVDKS